MNITIDMVTEDFLKKNDGKLVYIRDDYLSMKYYEKRPEVLAILNKVEKLKVSMQQNGYVFKT